MNDEENVFRRRRDQWFRDVETGNLAAVERTLGLKALRDFRGDVFEWLTMTAGEDRTAFLIAGEAGQVEVLRLLASRGANVHAVDSGGDSALHAAASKNQTITMQYLIQEARLDIDGRNRSQATPLHIATNGGHLDAMRLLLGVKASVDLQDKARNAPLAIATRADNRSASALLLACGASMHLPDGTGKCPPEYADERMTHIFWFHAALHGDVAGLRRLLARQIGAQGDEGFRELGRALYQPQGQDTLKLNLHRILCNARDADGFTALSICVQHGHVDAAAYLLSQTADASISDDARETPLHHAARSGHVQLVNILIEEGAPLEALNWGDAAPLHIAAFLDRHVVARALLNAKASVHLTDKHRQTPMHLAVLERNADTVQVLLNAGASLSTQDQDFKTVGDRAAEATQNVEKPRPRKPQDTGDYDEKYVPPKPAQTYVVVHSKVVAVRDAPSLTEGKVIGARAPGEKVLVSEVKDGWAKLDRASVVPHKADKKRTSDSEAWMLLDATAQGLGPLLEPQRAEPKAEKAADDAATEAESDDGSDFEG